MASTQISLTPAQDSVLGSIINAAGKVDYVASGLDKRSIGALERRGLVKCTETKKGSFVIATAKGKKHFN